MALGTYQVRKSPVRPVVASAYEEQTLVEKAREWCGSTNLQSKANRPSHHKAFSSVFHKSAEWWSPAEPSVEVVGDQNSPFKGMSYFDTITAIRNDVKRNQTPKPKARPTTSLRNSAACKVATPAPRSNSKRSEQHLKYTRLNMLSHISKYDCDRGNLNMSRANQEKHLRRSINARNKKAYQDSVSYQKKFADVVLKV